MRARRDVRAAPGARPSPSSRAVLDPAAVGERAAEPEPERAGERGLDHARRSGSGARRVAAPRPSAPRRSPPSSDRERRGEPRGGPVRDVVGARRRRAEARVALVAVADHRVERVHRAVPEHARARPATAPQNSGATTASTVFSATDSIAARHSPAPSSCCGVAPDERADARARAPSRSSRSTSAATACGLARERAPAERGPQRDRRARACAAARARAAAAPRDARRRRAPPRTTRAGAPRRAGTRRARAPPAARPKPGDGMTAPRVAEQRVGADARARSPAARHAAPPRVARSRALAVVHPRDGPAAVVGVQLGDRQRGDVDAPERARRRVQRVRRPPP